MVALMTTFQPHQFIRNPHVQTILTRYPTQAKTLQQQARPIRLQVEDNIRLQGLYSPHPQAKGLVLLFHGWLGCTESNYVLAIGEHLYQKGYAIFRLNLRDHGNTIHLNSGAFRSDLLAEVFSATHQISQFAIAQNIPFYIVGASLGGNFTLRLIWQHIETNPILNLAQAVAINPVIDPYQSTLALDSHWLYRFYFRQRWQRAMLKKMHYFPERYDFSKVLAEKTCLAMTEAFMRDYSPYPNALTYFETYAIKPTMFTGLETPVTIITAADDPVIPVEHFQPFHNLSPYLQVNVQPYGGHVGFINLFPHQHWLAQAVEMAIV